MKTVNEPLSQVNVNWTNRNSQLTTCDYSSCDYNTGIATFKPLWVSLDNLKHRG